MKDATIVDIYDVNDRLLIKKEEEMPYDSSLDQQVFSKEWGTERGKLVVSVHSYNNGPKKLQIVREIKDREGRYNFARLGRLSKEELEAILPFVKEAMDVM